MFIPAVHIEDWRLVAWWCRDCTFGTISFPKPSEGPTSRGKGGAQWWKNRPRVWPCRPRPACVGPVCVSEQVPPLFCPINHFTPISTSCTSLFSQGRTMIMASHPRFGHTLPSVIGRHLHCSLVAALPNTPSASPASLARKYHDPKWSSSDLQLKPCAKSVVCSSP